MNCILCGHDGKDYDTFAKAPKQCCAYIGGGGSGMCLCHCVFPNTQSDDLAAEIFQQITCNNAWHANTETSGCPDCEMTVVDLMSTQSSNVVNTYQAVRVGLEQARRIVEGIAAEGAIYNDDEILTSIILIEIEKAIKSTASPIAEELQGDKEEGNSSVDDKSSVNENQTSRDEPFETLRAAQGDGVAGETPDNLYDGAIMLLRSWAACFESPPLDWNQIAANLTADTRALLRDEAARQESVWDTRAEQHSPSDVLANPDRDKSLVPEIEVSESSSSSSPNTAGELPARVWISAQTAQDSKIVGYALILSEDKLKLYDPATVGQYVRVHSRELQRTEICKEVVKRLRTSTVVESAAAWRPIEEAPRDKTPIVVLYASGAIVKVQWEDVDYNEFTDTTSYDWVPVGSIYSEHDEQPLGWLPSESLPLPPQSKQEKE